MNTLLSHLERCALRPACLFLLILVLGGLQNAGAQTFQLQGREYRPIEGKWYTFSNGQKGDEIVPDRLIVRLKDRSDLRGFNFARVGIENVDVISDELFGGYYVLKVGAPQDPFAIVTALSRNPLVDYVEFDAIGEFHATPSDPLYPNQWNLPKISMASAWDITTGSNSALLAIIDTGTDYNHEDLDGNIWVNPSEDRNGNGRPDFTPVALGGDLDGIDNDSNGYVDDLVGWDFYSGDNNPWPDSDPGVDAHGTAVAGIAAAQTHNYESGSYRGVAGVAGGWGSTSGVKLMILRYYYYSNGPYASTTAQSVRYAARNGARVINISSGWATDFSYLKSAIDSAANVYGCVLVASAGNIGGNGSSDKSIRYPARYSTTIAVGATVQDDSRWVTSGNNGSATGPELDVMAPGGASIIWTTDITGSAGYNSTGDYYCCFGGTSAAAPHVAGLAALIRSVNPSLTWQQVRDILRNSAVKVSGMGGQNFTNEYGYGRINAFSAASEAFRTLIPTIVGLESAPAGVKIRANPIPIATSYVASKSPSSGGPFTTHGQVGSVPAYVSTAWLDIRQPPPYPWVVDTDPYYWVIRGQAGGVDGTTSAPAGPVRAWQMRSSSTPSATHNNNQRKMARGAVASMPHVMVYESNGEVFYARSTDAGVTWQPEELVSQGDGRYSNPTIESVWYYIGMSSFFETYVAWEENPVNSVGYRIWFRMRDENTGIWGAPVLVHEDLISRPATATPSISGQFVFWRGPGSILWKNFMGIPPPASSVPGTDANSGFPAVDLGGLSWTADLVWDQAGTGVRYRKGYLNANGSASWDPVRNVADNDANGTNSHPVVVRDYTGNACIAWKYQAVSGGNGNIKSRKVDPGGNLSSVTTFSNCGVTLRSPYGPALSNHYGQNSDDLSLVWYTQFDGIVGAQYTSGTWSSPFLISAFSQYAGINSTSDWSDNQRLAMFTELAGPPYRVRIQTVPLTGSLAPCAPQNLQMGTKKVTSTTYYPKLTWTANSEANMASYKIYRRFSSDPSGSYSNIASVSHPTTSYIDNIQVGNLDTAYYKITGVNTSSLESDFSNTVNIQTNVTRSRLQANHKMNSSRSRRNSC